MHLPAPKIIDNAPYLRYDDLLSAVADDLFPNKGIQTRADYDHAVETADAIAHANHYYIRHTLHPPTVPFGQHGVYLEKVSLDADSLLTIADRSGYSDNNKPRFIVGHPTLLIEYKIINHISDDSLDAALNTFIRTTMLDNDWAISELHGTHKQYARPLQVESDDLTATTPAMTDYIKQQNGNLLNSEMLCRQLYVQLFGRSYYRLKASDLPPHVITFLHDLLHTQGYDPTPSDRGYYVPKPPTLPADLAERIRCAIIAAPTYEAAQRIVIDADQLAATIRSDLPTLTPYQWQQLVKDELHPILLAVGYDPTRRATNKNSFTPKRDKLMYTYTAAVTVHSSEHHQLIVTRPKHDKEDSFPVIAPILIIDEDNDHLVALQMIGPLESLKANFARFAGSRTQIAHLNDITIKQRGMYEHIAIRETLPMGVADWLILSKQATVEQMNPADLFYILCEDSGLPPAFFPMLDRALSIPLQPHWASYLWQAGQQHDLISITNPITVGLRAYTILGDAERWQLIIETGLKENAIAVHDVDGQPVTLSDVNLPQPDASDGLISSYSTDQALEDGVLQELQTMHNNPAGQQLLADIISKTTFPLGRLIYSSDVANAVEEDNFNPLPYLQRHSQQDWGDLDAGDKRLNKQALKHGDRLFSMYETDIGKIYIISEHDRSVTSVITPSEY